MVKAKFILLIVVACFTMQCSKRTSPEARQPTPTPDRPTPTDEAYYDWEVTDSLSLSPGVQYRRYSFTGIHQRIYTVEIDLTNPNVTLETVMADEQVPNPNANGNANNGKNLRETLSETATRRRAEGRNIVAGINTGFFNSHDGFPRGVHIEDGEPVFVNNPDVRERLVNHRPGLTFFEDRTVSFGIRAFSGAVDVAGQRFEFYSINDTIVRLNNVGTYDANLYTYRFVETPHEGIPNPIGSEALFVVARNTDGKLQVNEGGQAATVQAIIDGRDGQAVAPYVTDTDEWVLQVTGDKADALKAELSVGMPITISTTLTIDGAEQPIKLHNASMYHYVQNSVYVAPASHSAAETIDPTTNVGLKADGTTLVLFCVDGRSNDDRGLNFYEAYRVAIKLGLQDVVRFDGGGSTTMWVYHDGEGKVMNNVSDSRGERSCMNYLHVRVE